MNRRDFLLTTAAALPLARAAATTPQICFFSKPLAGMDWPTLARTVKQIGCSGVDLTVRPGGHVLPERVGEDLPRALDAIRKEGLDVPLITTELHSAQDPAAQATLGTAGKLGIPFFKPGYYSYKFANVVEELNAAKKDFQSLAVLAQEKRVRTGFHNHTGNLGGVLADTPEMLAGLDPAWAGYYFDPAHATAEGGGAGWKVALNRFAPRIFLTAIKDFVWEKRGDAWRERWCPLGQGMVDFKYYFRELARVGFNGPISLHIEYRVEGGTENIVAAAKRDYEYLVKQL